MGYARYVLGIAGAAGVVAACTLPPPGGGGGGDDAGCATTSCADATADAVPGDDATTGTPDSSSGDGASGGDAADDAATTSDADAGTDEDASDGASDEDAGGDPDAGSDPDSGAGSDAGAPGTITCTYTALRDVNPLCAACNVPPEETIVKENVVWSVVPAEAYCRSATGAVAARSARLAISDLLAKFDSAPWVPSYQLAGAPPSETYKWLTYNPGCGPILGGGGNDTTISVVDGVMKVNVKYMQNPSVLGCGIVRGCFRKLLTCTGTVNVP